MTFNPLPLFCLGFIMAVVNAQASTPLSQQHTQPEVEVLHWWTSKGEQRAAAALKQAVNNNGMVWKDFAVRGGGGESAMTVLQARAIAGNPPTMAQIEGPAIEAWARLGFLTDLESIAQQQQWQQSLPDIALKVNRYRGHFVAIPLTLHRINWMWLNKQVFTQLNLAVPHTWPEFMHTAAIIKQAGITPLAIGHEPWQVAMIFEMMSLGLHGAEHYRQLLVELNPDAITSTKTLASLKMFRQLAQLVGPKQNIQEWPQVTSDLAQGKAAMQLLGDWVKGELSALGYQADVDYLCAPAPGTQDGFIYNMDSFVLFSQNSAHPQQVSQTMANLLMDKTLQSQFNQLKGSLPARQDVDLTGFDSCSLKAKQAFDKAKANNNLVPSLIDSMALPEQQQNEIIQLLHRYFYQSEITPEQVVQQLLNIQKRLGQDGF
ncbi:ABC transporter substrate-binding protein [Motilimonas eburnea]|uniref:ABC transporter substrate-binding protein n=1 Tax=Motilimonas eburnea TaxID=1737488 RepID=UPI001E4EC2FA|nr:ABC transporter substrate-binding protein [Motilimonas eburnea]MCE2570693.1 ABC transporter substrate-binding protein [Motilimonas eburnea]